MLRINLWCVLEVWVVILPEIVSFSGSPAPPTRPDCFIPCDEDCRGDIHCTWAPGPDPQTPRNYTLHWESSYSENQHVFCGLSLNGSIKRTHIPSHDDLRVWVQAKNHHGSAKSPVHKFNTEEIFKPPPPKVTWSDLEPLGISWTSSCDQLKLSLGFCDIRYRTEASQDWIKATSDHGSFTFLDPEPCSAHEVQVRCACDLSSKSDWSESLRKTSTGTAGEMDVWRDCGTPPQSSDCVLTWKKLTPSQACGRILGYEMRLTYLNGSDDKTSIAEDSGRLVCEEMKCYLNSTLKNVSSVSVLAFNAHGAGVPSYLSMPVPGFKGKGEDKKGFDWEMTEDNLTVSWDFSAFSDTLKEYVVQYKQFGRPLGEGLDWVRVSNRHTTTSLNGHFKRYTPYQVSLLTVSHSNLSSSPSSVQHLSSVTGFSLQDTPSKVPSFYKVSSNTSHATVAWEPVPLHQQNGIILYYQIGVNGQNVYNVSSSDTTKQLSVQPGQKHDCWIRAVTKAGPGEKTTLNFTISSQTEIGYSGMVLSLLPVTFLVVVTLVLVCVCPKAKTACPLMAQCFQKVPDPRNSLIFRQKIQVHELSDWLPFYESHPEISLLEVVDIQSWALKKTPDPEEPTKPSDRHRSSQMDCTDEEREDTVTGDSQRINNKYRTEAYSKIVDSEEEGEEAEDCWGSSEEELVESGYEKHFMPTAEEIQCDA
ncbi:interleukin 12 receptor, beta 2a, like [Halichoeres trimaculatus]|uniref:interleukin 12 receptor, beta 2a, like n=1 Tax=Halichoeres trimaculatus TaxID=147232 RepID=UPI003D9F86F0